MSDENTRLDLAGLQSWLQRLSTHPAGLDAAIVQAQRDAGLADRRLEAVVESNYGIGARQRVGIYHHGYFARLLACLRAEYTVLSKALSDEWFETMGLRYLAHCPPTSWTLADLGAGFPGFLAADRPDSTAAPADRTPAFDFIVDLARLERTVAEINRGPGTEGTDPDFGAYDRFESGNPDGIRLDVSPGLRLLRSKFALREYYEMARANEDVAVPNMRSQWIALCRSDYRVSLYEVDEWQFDLLEYLTEEVGMLGPALLRVEERHPDSPVLARWPVWLGVCAERRFFSIADKDIGPRQSTGATRV